jgi:hypothetical protein
MLELIAICMVSDEMLRERIRNRMRGGQSNERE